MSLLDFFWIFLMFVCDVIIFACVMGGVLLVIYVRRGKRNRF